jgi:alpha-D-ribose 1-methylphosphonate 5-phosphate C-P lyase
MGEISHQDRPYHLTATMALRSWVDSRYHRQTSPTSFSDNGPMDSRRVMQVYGILNKLLVTCLLDQTVSQRAL